MLSFFLFEQLQLIHYGVWGAELKELLFFRNYAVIAHQSRREYEENAADPYS